MRKSSTKLFRGLSMSKSIKRNNKYLDYYDYDSDDEHYDHYQKLKEKRLKAILRSKHKYDLLDLVEED